MFKSKLVIFVATLMLAVAGHGNVVSNVVTKAMQAVTAEEAIEVATTEVFDLISTGAEYVDEDPERFYGEVHELLDPMIDFKRFARGVMGVWYKKATPEQFERFSESFKWSLVKTYAAALTEFSGGDVRVLPPKRRPTNPDKSLVTMEVDYQGKTYVAVYDMRRKAETWQLVNVSIEGINVGLNFKSQFDSAMKGPKYGRDLDRVIDAWIEQIGSNAQSS